ncbi:MAG: 50S ribosomal protein L6 [Desulfobacterales bacterium]|jgi:large subunit ribosomal protein L6|nr:50S ribosomal protein L6 [Desulfobacteraceae bacterium]MDD3991337.1 50S ribosomal protein L6 [Desulfobacteraceae bacterium]MDY0310611.1 50S ribosomal protein L6 [Desulfobacterales bacterium]
MSRVGKKPIPIPPKTEIGFAERVLTVKGAKGTLVREIHPAVDLKIESGEIQVTTPEGRDRDKEARALQGLTRSLVANMVTGVDKGFERVLEINGIGYRANVKGTSIEFNLGYSHPIIFDLPDGIGAAVEKNTLRLQGIDKEVLGQTAASIRRLRPPEPYKGKGIKFAEEHIQRKAGKTGTK